MRSLYGTAARVSKCSSSILFKLRKLLPLSFVSLLIDFLIRFSKKYRDAPGVCKLSQKRSRNRVLIADESTFYRKHISKYLVSSGYQVETFRCGESALSALTENHHDTDFVVTGVTGGCHNINL